MVTTRQRESHRIYPGCGMLAGPRGDYPQLALILSERHASFSAGLRLDVINGAITSYCGMTDTYWKSKA